MNNIYILGKIFNIGKIQFKYVSKLEIYCEIEVINDTNVNKCILKDSIIDKYYSKLNIDKMVYIIGHAIMDNLFLNIVIDEMLFLE